MQAVIVQAGSEEYALPIESVLSIEKLQYITRIPHFPAYLLGLMKSRDQLVPILDFSQILYNTPTPQTDDSYVVVLMTELIEIGLLVKDAKEILELPDNRLTSTALKTYSNTPYFITVANLANRVITVVDPTILSSSLAGMNEVAAYVKEQSQSS